MAVAVISSSAPALSFSASVKSITIDSSRDHFGVVKALSFMYAASKFRASLRKGL